MSYHQPFLVRFNWQMKDHLVQVLAPSVDEARRIVEQQYPGSTVANARRLD